MGWFSFIVFKMFDCGEATEHEHRAPLLFCLKDVSLTGRVEVKMAQWYEIDNAGYVFFFRKPLIKAVPQFQDGL